MLAPRGHSGRDGDMQPILKYANMGFMCPMWYDIRNPHGNVAIWASMRPTYNVAVSNRVVFLTFEEYFLF